MSRNRRSIVALVGLVCGAAIAPEARPVSRVGNNRIVDEEEGYEVGVPEGFVLQRTTDEGGAVFLGIPSFRGAQLATLTVRPARIDYPEIADMAREDVERYFKDARDVDWVRSPAAAPCVASFVGRTSGGWVGVAFWGAGRGQVVLGPDQAGLRSAIEGIHAGLELREGACAWP